MTDTPLESQRLDVWLDVACLFKTRAQAQTACKAGKVDVDGQRGKPHRAIRPGNRLDITRPGGKQIVVVVGLAEQHIPKKEARQLYDDQTPPPTPEQLAIRQMERMAREERERGSGMPKGRERRRLRELKGKG